MPQASKILGFIVVAFLIFITSKGELKKYLSFFKFGTSAGSESGNDLIQDYGKNGKTVTSVVTGAADKIQSAASTAYTAAQTAAKVESVIQEAGNSENLSGEEQIAQAIAGAGIADIF